LDLALRGVELDAAEAVELLAALPKRDRLVERGLAALEPLHDLLELALRRLEGRLSRHGRRIFRRSPRCRSERRSRPSLRSARSPRRRARSRSRGSASPSARARAGARRLARARTRGVSCSWPTAETTATGQPAIARTRRSSLNGSRSSKLPPPRATTITSSPGTSHRRRSASTIAAAARGPWT